MKILAFFLILIFVTVLGHGIWMLFAVIFRHLFGTPSTTDTEEELRDLAAMSRQLHSFLGKDEIDLATYASLQHKIEERRRQLTAPPERRFVEDEILTVTLADEAEVSRPAVAEEPRDIRDVAPFPPREVPAAREPEEVLPVLVPEAEAVPPAPVARPRRSFLELLTPFMEQRNILWGELIGGLLIVGCCIALVISLWSKLEQIPYFPFLIFASITASLFGAGLYTLHHWKLETTSRGLLAIAGLLVPLNFLVMAGLQQREGSGWLEAALGGASLIFFGWLLVLSARVLVPEGRWLMPAALLTAAAAVLLVPWLMHDRESLLWLCILGGVPVGVNVAASGMMLYSGPRDAMTRAVAHPLFLFLGSITFAAFAVLGFLAYYSALHQWNGVIGPALHRLAALFALAGVPLLVGGLTVHRGLEDESESGPVRLAGTAVALTGMAIMLAAVGLAWPQPIDLILVCAFNAFVLGFVAFRYRLPVAHAVVIPSLALAYLSAYHLYRGTLQFDHLAASMIEQTRSNGGTALVWLVLAMAVAAEVMVRLGRRGHGIYYAAGAGVLALCSLALVTVPHDGQVNYLVAAKVYAIYGVGGLAFNVRWRRPLVTCSGLAVLVGATLWTMALLDVTASNPYWGTVLAIEALLMGVAGVLLGHRAEENTPAPNSVARFLGEPLARSGEGAAALAVLAAFWTGITARTWDIEQAITGGCLTALFFLLGLVEARKSLMRVTGVLLIGTVIAATRGLAPAADNAFYFSLVALTVAASGVVMATVAVWASTRHPLFKAWRETALGAGFVAMTLTGCSLDLGLSELPTYSVLLCSMIAMLLAWASQSRIFTWIGSTLVLGGIMHAISLHFPDLDFPRPGLYLALLAHASLGAIVTLLLDQFVAPTNPDDARRSAIQRLFARPIGHSALLTSFLAVPLLLVVTDGKLTMPAIGLFWLAALWLGVSVVKRWPVLFSAFQLVLTAAVFYGSLAWLQHQPWFLEANPTQRGHWGLQSVGVGLAGLSLLWMATRLLLRNRQRARELLEPGWRTVDRFILAAVVLGHFAGAARLLPILVLQPWAANGLPVPNVGNWLLIGLLALALIVALWDRRAALAVLGLVLLAIAVPLVAARAFESARDMDLALRWGLALAFLCCSAVLWAREPLYRYTERFGCQLATLWPVVFAHFLLAIGTVLPVLVLSILGAIKSVTDHSPFSHVVDASFGPMNLLIASVIPLALLCVGLIGHAFRERSSGYAFAAGIVTNAAVLCGNVLAFAQTHASPTFAQLQELVGHLVLLGTIVAAAWALLWIWARSRSRWQERIDLPSPLLMVQVAMSLLACTIALAVPVARLIANPDGRLPDYLLQSGGINGWLAFALTTAAFFWCQRAIHPNTETRNLVPALGFAVLGLGATSACLTSRWDGGNWIAYHVLTAGWTVGAVVVLVAGRLEVRFGTAERPYLPAQFVRAATSAIGAAVLFLAVRGAWQDPQRPYWSGAAVLAAACLFGAMAFWARSPVYVYISGLLVNVVGAILWIGWEPDSAGSMASILFGAPIPDSLIYTQVLCFAAASCVWSALEAGIYSSYRAYKTDGPYSEGAEPSQYSTLRGRWFPFAHVSARLGLLVLGVTAAAAVATSLTEPVHWHVDRLAWVGLAATALAFAFCLWDPDADFPLASLYSVGLIAIALVLSDRGLLPREYCRLAALTLACYVLMAAGVYRLAPRLSRQWQALRLPARPEDWVEPWFLRFQAMLGCLVILLSLWISLDEFHHSLGRLNGPLAVAVLMPAGVLMAQWGRNDLQLSTLGLGVVAVAELGWALLDPAGHSTAWLWLHRNVILLVGLSLLTALYGVVLARRLPPGTGWAENCRRMGPVLGVVASAVLSIVLVQELFLYGVPLRVAGEIGTLLGISLPAVPAPATEMALPAVLVVALALVMLMAAAMGFAILPGRDPLGLSEEKRSRYVYAAEAFVVLLMLHLRVTMPWLFRGILREHWPFVIWAIAFLGVGLSEYFRRRGLRVLARPLERTGVFLPLLPMLAFWALPPGRYALIWFLIGLLYGFLSATKRSFLFALLAALAANCGLWVLLHHTQFLFHHHPQMWLIPLALIVLVSEHLNHDRLTPSQSTGLRYLGLIVIYVSSTADMFIAGLGHSVVLPLVLALLSVGGVLLGILLRVRAFLFLGTAFLFLVVFTMIWHAAVDQYQTWVWWASGIVLGVAILVLFGIFEKRRQDVVNLLEN